MADILIVGSNRGIGLELVKACKARGDAVTAVCRHASEALEQSGARVVRGVDVTDAKGRDALVQALAGARFDAIWIVAGILRDDALGSIDEASIRAQLETNAIAPSGGSPARVCGASKPSSTEGRTSRASASAITSRASLTRNSLAWPQALPIDIELMTRLLE